MIFSVNLILVTLLPWFCAVIVVECVLNYRFAFDETDVQLQKLLQMAQIVTQQVTRRLIARTSPHLFTNTISDNNWGHCRTVKKQ